MASVYTQLKKGSSGNEVNALQTELSKKGYALQNTGLYDDATEAAVRKYQQDNNLTVDGVAGDITLGTLYGTNNAAAGGFTPSAQLTEAQKYAQSVQAQKPANYQSAYTPQMQAQFDAIMNRQPFRYDIGSDAMFQQMSDMYSQQARRGMQDAMGQAAALTGGYGNSYAQGAGQAAYGQQMQQLAAIAPEYMNSAYSRWQNEGVDMMNRYNMLAQQEESDYGRYVDAMNRYWQEADRAQQQADSLYNREYGEYMDNLNWQQAKDEMAFQREQYQNQLDMQNKEFEFQREQYQGKLDSESREYAYQTALMLLQGGKMPSADLLKAAGLSDADAQLIQSMYAPRSSGSGDGSDEKSKKENTSTSQLTNAVTTGIRAKSGTEALKEGVKNGTIKLTNTDVGDGVMSYNDWVNNKGILPDAGMSFTQIRDINTGKTQTDAYNEYVLKNVLSDFKSGKKTAVEADTVLKKNLR